MVFAARHKRLGQADQNRRVLLVAPQKDALAAPQIIQFVSLHKLQNWRHQNLCKSIFMVFRLHVRATTYMPSSTAAKCCSRCLFLLWKTADFLAGKADWNCMQFRKGRHLEITRSQLYSGLPGQLATLATKRVLLCMLLTKPRLRTCRHCKYVGYIHAINTIYWAARCSANMLSVMQGAVVNQLWSDSSLLEFST